MSKLNHNLLCKNMPKSGNRYAGSRVTAHDVAKVCGVSHMTVSRAFSKTSSVADKTRKRIEKVARQLGYKPNMAARTMRTGSTKTIGIALPGLQQAMTNLKLESIEKALSEEGYHVSISFTNGQTEQLIEVLDNMSHRQVDGLIINHDHSLSSAEQSQQVLKKLQEIQVPIVISDASDFDKENKLPGVSIDRGSVMYDVAAHLKEIGKDDVWMWMGPATHSNKGKYNAFVEASYKYGLNTSETDISEYIYQFLKDSNNLPRKSSSINFRNLPFTERLISDWRKYEKVVFREVIRKVFSAKEPPTAALFYNDLLAMIAIQELHNLGLRIPEDVAIVGYNDVKEAKLTSPPLTTVHQPKNDMAQQEVSMLLEQLRGDSPEPLFRILPSKLVIRESTVGKGVKEEYSYPSKGNLINRCTNESMASTNP